MYAPMIADRRSLPLGLKWISIAINPSGPHDDQVRPTPAVATASCHLKLNAAPPLAPSLKLAALALGLHRVPGELKANGEPHDRQLMLALHISPRRMPDREADAGRAGAGEEHGVVLIGERTTASDQPLTLKTPQPLVRLLHADPEPLRQQPCRHEAKPPDPAGQLIVTTHPLNCPLTQPMAHTP